MTGISKGAGMIKPNMATMLGYLAFDAKVAQPVLDELVKFAADRSFNSITIDGDTSTNDSFMLIATGAGSLVVNEASGADYEALKEAVTDISRNLAQQIIRDGEGATKFITITVEEGKTLEECRKIAYAIAHSPLVKTAFFASDPNLGRILAAVGYAGVDDLDVTKLDLYLDDVWVAKAGGRNPDYQEADGQRVMKQAEILVRVTLGRGDASRHGVDLRPVARLRQHQRRLPLVIRMTPLEQFLHRAENLLARVEAILPPASGREPDWKRATAFRWRRRATGGGNYLQPVLHAIHHPLRGLAARRGAKGAAGAEHAPVRGAPPGQQRAADGRARHR